MELLIGLVCGVGGIALLGACAIVPFSLKYKANLRSLSDQELSGRVFRFEPSYFNCIGLGEPTVLVFQRLVDAKDLRGIASRWPALRRSFTRLERRVGHRGRSLIVDYYGWYGFDYRELMRRHKTVAEGGSHDS
jgi:hypothetical protein